MDRYAYEMGLLRVSCNVDARVQILDFQELEPEMQLYPIIKKECRKDVVRQYVCVASAEGKCFRKLVKSRKRYSGVAKKD